MKRRTLLTGSLVACSGVAIGVAALRRGRSQALVTVTGPTMGTFYQVRIPADTLSVEALRSLAGRSLNAVESRMSTYLPDSELARFNRQLSATWTHASAHTVTVIGQALELSRRTDGAFDPTVGPLVELWGFGAAGRVETPPSDRELADAATGVGFSRLRTSASASALRKTAPGLEVDLSGIAKGFAVDRLAQALDTAGVASYLVDVGGELRARGNKPGGRPWRVGIERPAPGRRDVHRIVHLEQAAIATSGDYRRFFVHGGRRYTHAIDPRTAHPVSHSLASVSVIADDAMTADALSTALMVMGPEEGYEFARNLDIAALFIAHDTDGYQERSTPPFGTYLLS
ncbi:MAG: FAD:protein FMN transferase [Gammaproteobacteria bacterium]